LYESALRIGLPRPVERVAQLELAQLAKRERDYTRAIPLWDALREAPGADKRTPAAQLAEDARKGLEFAIQAAEQLAIYYEHRVREPRRALDLIRAALAELHDAARDETLANDRAAKIEERLCRRLQRLQRSCDGALSSSVAIRKSI
jgi:hypothetical protein